MLARISRSVDRAAEAVALSPAAARGLALLPLALLAAYWSFGEWTLIVAAFALPGLAAALARPGRAAADGTPDPDGLMTRPELADWLATEMAGQRQGDAQFAVITLSIDDFDGLENRYGRAMAAAVRREAVRRLVELLRSEDCIAALDRSVFAFGLKGVRAP